MQISLRVQFRSPAKQDFRLLGSSPLRNAGEYQGWMDGATDLIGNPRILYGEVGVACRYWCGRVAAVPA